MTIDINSWLEERNALATKHQALCPSPWNTLDIRYSEHHKNSVFQTCCCNLDAKIFEPGPESDPFAEIKVQQNQGQWPKACFRCEIDENAGGQSERIRTFIELPQDRLIKFLHRRQVDEFELRVKFSNFCNLSCRSCSATESSTFAKTAGIDIDPGYTEDISNNPEYWQHIIDSITAQVDKQEYMVVHFIGGETLVQPGMTKLLQWMVDMGIAPRITVRLTTALTVNPSRNLLALLSEFRKVDILLSIDSVGENYRYVRWPARFEKIENNLETLVNFRPEMKIVNGQKTLRPRWNIAVSPVFSLNNWFYAESWLDYWHAWYRKYRYSFLNYVAALTMSTNHLDIQALPMQYRPALIDLIQRCCRHDIFTQWPENMKGVYNFFQATLTELNNDNFDSVLWYRYLALNAYFDKKTGLEFEKFNDRLYNMLTLEDQDLWTDIKFRTDDLTTLPSTLKFVSNV